MRDLDNPFAPPYILDAIGMSARIVYPNPRIWRPFMERVVADLTPAANKVYITLNRHLADRGVLPEIKAALRARSEFRPADDRDLIPTFSKMLHEAGQSLPTDVVVPEPGRGSRRRRSSTSPTASGKAAETVGAILPSSVAPIPVSTATLAACTGRRSPRASPRWDVRCPRPRHRAGVGETRCSPISTR